MAEDVLVERWAFGDRNIFRNNGFQHVIAIAFTQLLANVIAHPAAAIKTGEQIAALNTALQHRLKNLQRPRNVIGRLQGEVVG